jgi:hypothetical protein
MHQRVQLLQPLRVHRPGTGARLGGQPHGEPVCVDELMVQELFEPILEAGLVVDRLTVEVGLHAEGVGEGPGGQRRVAELQQGQQVVPGQPGVLGTH